jgi:hypothetical protein
MTNGDADPCAACPTGSVCVEQQFVGGYTVYPDEAGVCPNGRIMVAGVSFDGCSNPPSFHCATLPSTCTPPPGGLPAGSTCSCAQLSLCDNIGNRCTDISSSVSRQQIYCLEEGA